LPACYAITFPGLEEIAAAEIEREVGGEIKRRTPGLVVFRVPEITGDLLRLKTVEDVFLLAWGSDKLTYRATDLGQIRRWTAFEADWNRLLQIHHAIRPKPHGKPTYHLVTQMNGHHGYRRVDARKALVKGLAGKLPCGWRYVEENAAVEIWLTIDGALAVCGLRLSDRTMRHRTYKTEHQPASLRPSIAAAMVQLAEIGKGQAVLDPMCGAGTILGEVFRYARDADFRPGTVAGGDIEMSAVRSSASNLRRLGNAVLSRWDARSLPLANQSFDRIVCNPPFGKQLGDPEEIGPLYRRLVRQLDRVLRSGGVAVLLASDLAALKEAAARARWEKSRQVRVRVLGQPAFITVWRKPVRAKGDVRSNGSERGRAEPASPPSNQESTESPG
jgi:23S rRNA G2445 N2-methylase RlmL